MNWDRDGAGWPHREHSRFVSAGGLRWHVQEAGEGPVCLLLHGTGASTHSWAGLMPLLARSHRVVACDLPGHGFTSSPARRGLSLPGMSERIAALLSEIDAAPQLAIGHSAGAAVAIRMTLDAAIRPALIFGVNAALMPFKGLAGQVFPSLAKALVMNPFVPRLVTFQATEKRVQALLDSTGSQISPEMFRCYRHLFNDAGHVGAALGMMASWDLDALRRDWPKLDVPLHLIVGTRDGTVPPSDAREIERGIVGTTVHRLEGLGHLAHEEAPERVAELVDDAATSGVQRSA